MKHNSRNERFVLRLNKDEKKKLDEVSAMMGVGRGTLLRNYISGLYEAHKFNLILPTQKEKEN